MHVYIRAPGKNRLAAITYDGVRVASVHAVQCSSVPECGPPLIDGWCGSWCGGSGDVLVYKVERKRIGCRGSVSGQVCEYLPGGARATVFCQMFTRKDKANLCGTVPMLI